MVRSLVRFVAVAVMLGCAAQVGDFSPAVAAGVPTSVVEDDAYPGADQIFAERGIRLLKGDGQIRYVADCGSASNLFRVESLVGSAGAVYCFEVRGPRGYLTMDIPQVYLLWGTTVPVVAKATYQGTTETVTVALEPRGDRDLTLAKLDKRIMDIAPVALAGSAPAVGDTVQAVGYGRTATDRAGTKIRAGAFTVTAVAGSTLEFSRSAGTATDTCRGDAGGPALAQANGTAVLLAIHSTSWQFGCMGESGTSQGSTEVRLDDVTGWIRGTALEVKDSFGAFYFGYTGIDGDDFASAKDRIIPFDYEHNGTASYLVLDRPGDRVVYIVGRQYGT